MAGLKREKLIHSLGFGKNACKVNKTGQEQDRFEGVLPFITRLFHC